MDHVPAPTWQQAAAEKLIVIVLLVGMVAYIAKVLYGSSGFRVRRARSSDNLAEVLEDEGMEEEEEDTNDNSNHKD